MMGNQYGITHGMHKTSTYRIWHGMIARCRYPSMQSYPRYGGRGITVCDRWQGENGFINFLADMGERPGDLTLDRVDNDGNYTPENCRWATRSEQQRNKTPAKQHEVCKRGHIFADVGVYVSKSGARQCKQCAKERARAREAALRMSK